MTGKPEVSKNGVMFELPTIRPELDNSPESRTRSVAEVF